jgi:hypothetical protein
MIAARLIRSRAASLVKPPVAPYFPNPDFAIVCSAVCA